MIDLFSELSFRTSRSSGAGGQNVNKVETRVELLFTVDQSQLLSDDQKILVKERLANRIDTDGVLHMACQETRSQLKNKEMVVKRFHHLISNALKLLPLRKASKPSKAAIKARRENKKAQSEKKQARVKIKFYKDRE